MIGFKIVGILITFTAISSYINYRYIKLPKSIGITTITLILSLFMVIGSKVGLNVGGNLITNVKFNDTFLHGMLSFLLFAGSLHVNVLELSRYKTLITSLATFSVIFSTIFIGCCLYFLTQVFCINLPFYYCFVFGALISPTDPIAVLGVLKIVKAPKSLELKIAGEALFNDGVGIVLFFVTLSLAYGKNTDLSLNTVIFYFLRQGLGGLILGLVIGYLSAILLKNVNDPEIAIIFTLGLVSGGHYISHYIIEVSGPICMASAGLVISNIIKNGDMTEDTMIRLGSFWELLDEVLNAILFVLIGLEFIGIRLDLYTCLSALAAVSIALFGRWLSILIPIYALTYFKILNFQLLNVLTWSGLRGGVSIALALSIEGIYHDFLVSITYAVVIFSMMIQGISVSYVIKKYIRRKR
ncbi:MAG TPA: sodium:proton antiporter [Candidatus Azoamicus sp. OHIO2]